MRDEARIRKGRVTNEAKPQGMHSAEEGAKECEENKGREKDEGENKIGDSGRVCEGHWH